MRDEDERLRALVAQYVFVMRMQADDAALRAEAMALVEEPTPEEAGRASGRAFIAETLQAQADRTYEVLRAFVRWAEGRDW